VLAGQIGDRFRAVAELRAQTLAVDVEAGPHVVSAPPEWLDRLVGVLLDNACKYSAGRSAWRLVGTEAGSG
jgi:signal transduction histidine kinase